MPDVARCWILSLGLCAGLAAASAGAAPEPGEGARVLTASPACAHRRLGQVSVSLGSKEPDMRTGMPPSAVSYPRAFAKLASAARAKGGDAVVLRSHDAAYVAKGARLGRRPTYVSLQGAVIALADPDGRCALALLDPVAFERQALERQAQDSVKDTGTSF